MPKNTQNHKREPRIKNKFILFSVILFLVILIAGSITFVTSMRQITRTNRGVELSQMLETERVWLESTVNAEISMVLKMANSPVIRRHFVNPDDISRKEDAILEMDSFREFFSDGYEIFWINDRDRLFHIDNSEPFLLDPDNPDNYWYNMTLHETDSYNFNINYNPNLQVSKLWINAPVFDDNKIPVGMLGSGIDLSSFTTRIFGKMPNIDEMYLFNSLGEITGAADIELVKNKINIKDVLEEVEIDILATARELRPGETRAIEVSQGEVAVGTVPLLEWYSVAYVPDSISDYFSAMTTLFLVVLILMLVIFITFNIFISGFLKSLDKTMESLEIASNAKSTFLANMSHEIRTPMNAIIGITDIMMQDETLPEEMAEGLGKIYGSCDMLLGIINDILDFSKIEAGIMDVLPAQYHVASLINNSVNLNMMRIGEKPIVFELHVDENVPLTLIGDEIRIKQILNNLLSNAFKYTDEGKVILSVASEPNPENNGIILVFCVQDTGHGMSKEQLEKLFDEYIRFSEGQMRTIEGTGLGLAITQRLLYLMNGKVHVESEPGKGTTVTVRLPQETVDGEVLGKDLADNLRLFYENHLTRKKSPRLEHDPMPYGSVLIVDDVETNIYVAEGLLKLYGLQIETAMSGFEAIEKVQHGKTYDIIFMDHMMPDLDGVETTKRLREFGYSKPIVALTANAVAGQASLFMQRGFDNFISKPIDMRQLNLVLTKLIRDKQSPEVIEEARAAKIREIEEARKSGAGSGTDSEVSASPENVDHTKTDPLLLESFVRDAEKTVQTLSDLLDKPDLSDDDLRMFTITVHGIKSSLANLGEKRLSDVAFSLEEAGRDGVIDLITMIAPLFLDELSKLLETVQPLLVSKDTGDDPPDIIEKFIEIREMCADYNRRNAINVIDSIEICSEKTRAVLESVKEQVLESEYEEAEKIAGMYADEFNRGG